MEASQSDLRSIVRGRWPIIVVAWALPALLASLETWTFWHLGGKSYAFWRAVMMEAPAWIVYAVLTPFIFLLGNRLPLTRARFARNIVLHVLFAAVAGAAYAVIASIATRTFSPAPSTRPLAQLALFWYLSALPLTMLAYFCILGVGAAVTHFSEARQREIVAARLTAQLADARLAALRMQLHPHFLFNTLNAITVLARDGESDAVVRMLSLLSDLLRDVLRTDRAREIALLDELTFVRRYLDIEMVRFGDRLVVREDVDPALADALVPVFILQPLVENALRHGMAHSPQGGSVTLGAHRRDGALVLSVQDERPDQHGGDELRSYTHGVGLSNTEARLRELFGERASLSLEATQTGTLALITLPFRDA